MKKKIGIIGNGFVGNSIAFGFSPTHEIRIHDKDPKRNLNTIEEVLECDFIFVAVPTPMDDEGHMHLGVVIKALSEIWEKNKRTDNIIILKSTMTPGTSELLIEQFPNLNIIFNPEFLTERTAKLDFLTQARIILGGNLKHTSKVKALFEQRFMHCNVMEMDTTTAEMIKYMNNIFFASKVSIMNEFKQVCDKVGANWEKAVRGFAADQRIGDSHLNVPGPDGKYGFGGSCFPKDINAFMSMADALEVEVPTIKGAWKTNLNVRPEKDWENLEGRAVVKKPEIEFNERDKYLLDNGLNPYIQTR
jgi:UDPglucose 6-dehydrogenase|tara:strand:- start:5177 stop:6088 length:912 start_codon:yes stop_codon:yes gene_type:complete